MGVITLPGKMNLLGIVSKISCVDGMKYIFHSYVLHILALSLFMLCLAGNKLAYGPKVTCSVLN